MSLTIRKTTIGSLLAIAIAVLIITTIALLWPRSVDEHQPLLEESSLTAPLPFPETWAEQDATHRLRLQLDAEPRWTTDDGIALLRGPFLNDLALQWSTDHQDGWTVLSGEVNDGDTQIRSQLWSAPGFPVAIVEFEAHITGPALGKPLIATTAHPSGDAQLLGADLRRRSIDQNGRHNVPLLAGRFSTTGPTVQVYSPHGAVAHLTQHDDDEQWATMEWTLWPGLDSTEECFDHPSAARRVSFRLIIEFGDHPIAAPLSVPAGATALSTPIFVDAPNVHGDVWADGRARNADDMALRLRALAYGHSDRDDPRHGNGGLLAAGMGAVFAISPQWWNEDSIRQLRRSLKNSDIDVVPLGQTASPDHRPSGFQITDRGDCSTLFEAIDDGDAPPVMAYRSSSDHSFDQPLNTPLLPLAEIGQSSTTREVVLRRLFEPHHDDALFAEGEYRALFFPIVATRNPLEEIFSQKILSPDRGGHWTLHEDLTRRLSRRELSDTSTSLHSTGIEALRAHQKTAHSTLSFWSPRGTLEHHGDSQHPLYFFGALDELELRADDERPSAVISTFDDASPPRFLGTLSAVRIAIDGDGEQD